MKPISVSRSQVRLLPDPKRVITKPFVPGGHVFPDGASRVRVLIDRILALSDAETESTLAATEKQFGERHPDLHGLLERSFAAVANHVDSPDELSDTRRLLIGAYFIHEYAIEAAALNNPSIVTHPDQSDLLPRQQRFIMSLRGIGEGHISSIEFRTGVIDAGGEITIDEVPRNTVTGSRTPPIYDKRVFSAKLVELGAYDGITQMCLEALPPEFTFEQLEAAIEGLDQQHIDRGVAYPSVRVIHWLASSNYKTAFPADSAISQRVIFPAGPTESNGMEDARFVLFTDDDGTVRYYATYTAFDGHKILPQLIETKDFVSFRVSTLNGDAAHNKGMALFPRKIDGRYVALSRQDAESNHLILTDNIRFWHESERIQIPERPWELTQLGNCGSPLETEAGWLVITHGVGPFRQYTLGAILLDTEDPCRVIGHLNEPLLMPSESERDGYVPNVVYSCGAMIHEELLVLPYGFADSATSVATFSLDEILTRLTGT